MQSVIDMEVSTVYFHSQFSIMEMQVPFSYHSIPYIFPPSQYYHGCAGNTVLASSLSMATKIPFGNQVQSFDSYFVAPMKAPMAVLIK